MHKKYNINEIVRERKALGQSYITEAFGSKKLSNLLKNKRNLNVVKKTIFADVGIMWSDINDNDIEVYDIYDEIKKYFTTNDHLSFINHTLPLVDKNVITFYVSNITGNIEKIYKGYDFYDVVARENGNVYDVNFINIVNYILYSVNLPNFIQEHMLCDRLGDNLKDCLYIRDNKVNLLRTLYKMFVLCCYDMQYRRFVPFCGVSNALFNPFWANQESGSGVPYQLLNNIITNDCVINSSKRGTYIEIECDGDNYVFDFSVRGVSDDELYKRSEMYADILYNIDKDRKITKKFFSDVPYVMFNIALSISYGYVTKKLNPSNIDNVDIDIDVDKSCFLLQLLSCNEDFNDYLKNQYFLDILWPIYTKQSMLVYHIKMNDEHIKTYNDKRRQRKINNISGIGNSKFHKHVSSFTSYNENKEMLNYIYTLKDNIYTFADKIGDDGKKIIKTYNNLLIIDKKFDDFVLSPDMFKVLNDYIDKFISLVSDMMSNNQYNSDFDILYKTIISVYRNIVDKHYSDEYSDESEY